MYRFHLTALGLNQSIIMKAARYYGKKDIRIESIDPPVPRDNQVLVKVAWCGICGSDLKNYSYGTARDTCILADLDLEADLGLHIRILRNSNA